MATAIHRNNFAQFFSRLYDSRLFLLACYCSCIASAACFSWLLWDIEGTFNRFPDAYSVSYQTVYLASGAFGFFFLWHLFSALSSCLTHRPFKTALVDNAAPFVAVVISFLAAFPHRSYIAAEISRFHLVHSLITRAGAAAAETEIIFLAVALIPASFLALATNLHVLKNLRLDFGMIQILRCFIFLLLSGAACAGWAGWRERAFERRPGENNILFIISDALTPSHMSCYGYDKNTTPHIAQLAEEGLLFKNFIAASSWSLPSYTTIYTSRYFSYSLDPNGDGWRNPALNMAQIMADNGWYTKSLLTNPFAANAYQATGIQVDATMDFVYGSALLTDRAIGLLREHRTKRFFFHIQYMDPHGPYSPPEPYRSAFFDETEPCADSYDGEIAHLDYQISRLISELEQLELSDNTYVVITADHGEGIETCSGHIYSLENELINIPLIIWGPKMPRGKKIEQVAGHVDLLPTFVEWIGGKMDPRFQGKSLMPLIRDEEAEDRVIFSELYLPRTNPEYHYVSVRKGQWKLLTGDPKGDALYDVKTDPSEDISLVGQESEPLKLLKTEVERFRNGIERGPLSLQGGAFSKEEKDALKALGYVQ
ncbi:MAG: hypothetical protein C4520_14255 [Candidatus Abyssobacteria bacterium SURF_5]|uniref:Sulfatase N-terminal domain-containing protein n=1 Tax=Abyssobacteria bacterium (strain SURF_5) TaxID=2093360 RepID=A0A3A4NB39_ABYX5|nr:MAG: hypothetical protein C4520_14255 [Candidatus Abyssubacteria bacterium SURF_5]